MKAIVLAAGRGSRLGPLTGERPKCLVELAGRPLLDYQLAALRAGGVDEIALVTGYRAETLAGRADRHFHNDAWERGNMIASLRCAGEWLAAHDCIVAYSDLFYPASFVQALVRAEGDDLAMAYDPDGLALWSARFEDPASDAESLRVAPDGRLLEIGERAPPLARVEGQFIGLLRFSPAGWRAALEVVDGLAPAQASALDTTSLLSRLLARGRMIRAVATRGVWGEVDSAADLALYERLYGPVLREMA